MHTTKIGNTTFHHNGNFSGDVVVCVADSSTRPGPEFGTVRVSIPFADLKALVAEWVRREQIEALEYASVNSLLLPGLVLT